MGTTLPQQEGDAASSAPHTHAHHTQAMYSHQVGGVVVVVIVVTVVVVIVVTVVVVVGVVVNSMKISINFSGFLTYLTVS